MKRNWYLWNRWCIGLLMGLLGTIACAPKSVRHSSTGHTVTQQRAVQGYGASRTDSVAAGRHGYRPGPYVKPQAYRPYPTPSQPSVAAKIPAHLPHREVNPLATRPAIQEADLYRVKGHLLYYLHTYRGLTVFDLKDPGHPKRLASLPVYGSPVEMFVEGDIAYILVNNLMRLQQTANGNGPAYQELHKAQLLTVKLSNTGVPEILDSYDIPGSIREGTTRKRGDIIYTVSLRPAHSWYEWKKQTNGQLGTIVRQEKEALLLQSYQVGLPHQIKLFHSVPLERLQHFQRKTSNNVTETHSYQGQYILTATDQALMVGELWTRHRSTQKYGNYGNYYRHHYYRRYYYSRYRHCQDSKNETYTKVHLYDISDSKGTIRKHTELQLAGHLTDQFKQTYYEEKDGKKIYLGVTLQRISEYNSCTNHYPTSRSSVRNMIVSVDVTNAKARMLSELSFGKPMETVRGSTFDLDRRVAYVITAVQRDPLYAISFDNPSQLHVMSEIDGLSGDVQLFRTLQHGQFLLAVGRDTSNDCKGFSPGWWRSNVAVSLFDVRDLKRVRLIQRQCVSIQGANQTFSGIEQNRDQAHKMIGMHQIGQTHILTVPFSFHSYYQSQLYGYYRNAVGIMAWDLSLYDPKRNHLQQRVLENLGSFLHPHEVIKRTIIANISKAGKSQTVAINLSANYMSLIDLQNLRQPSYLASVSISQHTLGVFRWGKALVEYETEYRNQKQQHWLQIRSATKSGQVLGAIQRTISLGPVIRLIRWKEKLVIIRHPMKEQKIGNKHHSLPDPNRHEIAIYDFTNPYQPQFRTSKMLPLLLQLPGESTCGDLCQTGSSRLAHFQINRPHARSSLHTKEGMIFLNQRHQVIFGQGVVQNNVVMLDLSGPQIQYRTFTLPQGTYRGLVAVNDQSFFVVQQHDHYDNITYIQRWHKEQNQWHRDYWTAVPGHLLHVFPQGKTLQLISINGSYYHLFFSRYNPSEATVTQETKMTEYTMSAAFTEKSIHTTSSQHGQYWLNVYERKGEQWISSYRKALFQQPAYLRYVGPDYWILQTSRGLATLTNPQENPGTLLQYRTIPLGSGISIHSPMHFVPGRKTLYLAGQLAGIIPIPVHESTPIAKSEHSHP